MKQRSAAYRAAMLGLLTALALILGYVERLFPISAIPGIKIGLGNTVLLYSLYLIDTKRSWMLMGLKVVLTGLLFGTGISMAYSLAGGTLSLALMSLAKKTEKLSVHAVSVIGALTHNIGQLLVAAALVTPRAAVYYAPMLILTGIACGVLTGTVAKLIIKYVRH
ncbi:MAG: Gx transporter family protein [Clostridia bacterium]|nr:Gx transporter family protein [Clostridia bacterium]